MQDGRQTTIVTQYKRYTKVLKNPVIDKLFMPFLSVYSYCWLILVNSDKISIVFLAGMKIFTYLCVVIRT